MWPKAITTLIELAPHITRLVPMADRFFSSKSAETEASMTAMQQMAEGLRGDLGQVTASHAGLYRQLNDQSEKLSNIAGEQRSIHTSISSVNDRLTQLEAQTTSLYRLVAFGFIVVGLLVIALSIVLLHHA
jgi:septal ring factor EnvC (AmiA/AmiB activator)